MGHGPLYTLIMPKWAWAWMGMDWVAPPPAYDVDSQLAFTDQTYVKMINHNNFTSS